MTHSEKAAPKRKRARPRAAPPPEDEERQFFKTLYAEWIPLHDQRPPTLYHYTNAQGLLGIVQSNRLWATDARFLNDPSEIEYAAQAIRESITWVTKNYSSPLPPGFSEQVDGDLMIYEAEARVYLCCFCVEGDLLSQWRGYGAQGGGYAIGFDTTNFGDREVAMPPKPILRRVIYKPEVQQRLVRTWLQAMCDLQVDYRKASGRIVRNRLGLRLNTLIFTFRMLLSEFLLCFKNPAYEEEQEWRLIQFGRVDRKQIIAPLFRASGGRIIPYVKLDLTQSEGQYKDKLPIREMRFGPTLERETTARSLWLLALAAGYPPEGLSIDSSAIPFSGV